MNFAEVIVRYRKELGLTQGGLAQKLGVTNQAVSSIPGLGRSTGEGNGYPLQ